MSTATKLQGIIDSKANIKAALTTRGMNPTDILSTYGDNILGIKCWQELATFGIPQSEIDEKNTKWLDGIAYANELVVAYPDGEVPDGVLDKDRLLIYPFSNSSSLIKWSMFSGSKLEYFKDNIFNWNNANNYLPSAFKNCAIGNATINIPNANLSPLLMLFTFSGIKFGKAIINIPNTKLPHNYKYSYNNIFGYASGDELTINTVDFNETYNMIFFSGLSCNKLTINLSAFSGRIKSAASMFINTSIKELNIANNVPIIFEGTCDSFLAYSSTKIINFDIIGENCSFRNFFWRAEVTTLQIFDCRDILHRDGYDGYKLAGCFNTPLVSAKIKTSEGINLTFCPNLDEASITYLINNLSYPTHSDYANNGGTLHPTITVHVSTMAWLINEGTLLGAAVTAGYTITV